MICLHYGPWPGTIQFFFILATGVALLPVGEVGSHFLTETVPPCYLGCAGKGWWDETMSPLGDCGGSTTLPSATSPALPALLDG